MRILGISAFYHDSAAALVEDGHIIAAAQEERFSRKKHDARFPADALAYCLREGGISLGDVDEVVFTRIENAATGQITHQIEDQALFDPLRDGTEWRRPPGRIGLRPDRRRRIRLVHSNDARILTRLSLQPSLWSRHAIRAAASECARSS